MDVPTGGSKDGRVEVPLELMLGLCGSEELRHYADRLLATPGLRSLVEDAIQDAMASIIRRYRGLDAIELTGDHPESVARGYVHTTVKWACARVGTLWRRHNDPVWLPAPGPAQDVEFVVVGSLSLAQADRAIREWPADADRHRCCPIRSNRGFCIDYVGVLDACGRMLAAAEAGEDLAPTRALAGCGVDDRRVPCVRAVLLLVLDSG